MPESKKETSRHLTFQTVANSARGTLNRLLIPLGILLSVETFVLFMRGSPAAKAFLLIAVSSFIVLRAWSKLGRGLPMLALIAAQNLVIYGLPIIANNETIARYPAEYLTKAGWEVFTYNLAMLGAWRGSFALLRAPPPVCYALLGLERPSPKLTRLGMTLLTFGSAYQLLNSVNALDFVLSMLPTGTNSIVTALIAAVSACGFFLGGMMVGKGEVTRLQRATFWILLGFQCFTTASGFLLSAALLVVFASAIGLFWGSGRIPWRFITIVALLFGFLNLGKFVMRDKYWTTAEAEQGIDIRLTDMPAMYREWASASFDVLTGSPLPEQADNDSFNRISSDEETAGGQSLLQRINNLENLAYVIDAVGSRRIPTLEGATYMLIPPLLVPRIVWPNKPRSHEGQVLLNVHFGRQDLNATFKTYIAWGLLPEAYGNFGPIAGAMSLGLFLGALFGWLEQFTTRKLVLSLEGFLGFTLFLAAANSYEMVASVLVTSVFQAFVPIIAASMPFVERLHLKATASPGAAAATHG